MAGVALWGHSRSQTLFCVTGAGHRTLFRPCGRRDAFWTLLKRWQAWVKMRGALIFDVNLDGVLKGSRFVNLSSFSILDVMMIPCGRCRTSDASS